MIDFQSISPAGTQAEMERTLDAAIASGTEFTWLVWQLCRSVLCEVVGQ